MVSQTQLTPTEFLQAVLTEFGFKPFKQRKVELLDMLNMFLIEQYSNGKKVVLIVDEAQNLSKKVLEEIRMISGIETHKEKVLRIILAGPAGTQGNAGFAESEAAGAARAAALSYRPAGRARHARIHRRIAWRSPAAHRTTCSTETCFDVIYRYSGGVPRLINTLCDTALLCAFADEKATSEPTTSWPR